MKARIYKVKQGYDIVNSSNMRWKYTTKLKYLGIIDPKTWRSLGVLIENIPDKILNIVREIEYWENKNQTLKNDQLSNSPRVSCKEQVMKNFQDTINEAMKKA
jgi:hypothetical protein